MRHAQKGVTFIGWLFLLTPVAIVGYAGIRVLPFYMNYFKVSRALDAIAAENAGEVTVNQAAIRSAMYRRFDIETINHPPVEAIQVVREGEGWVLRAKYEEVAPLFGHMSILLRFEKSARIS